MKLGKRAPTKDARDFAFAHYAVELNVAVPRTFGYWGVIDDDNWKMLGNDNAGDCVFAGAAHETMLWTAEHRRFPPFDDKSVLSDYSAVTGYDPNDPNSDQGTIVRDALKYRQSTGIVDAKGNRHKIAAYASLQDGDWLELEQATFIFGAVGIGFNCPDYIFDQFNRNKPWTVLSGTHRLIGGHYVPVVGIINNNWVVCVSWGKIQLMSKAFWQKYTDENWAILSEETLVSGENLYGFDLTQLRSDLTQLGR